MKIKNPLAALAAVAALAGCMHATADSGGSQPTLSGRELRPPKSDIQVGSLYYVRETPTTATETPADLQDLCIFRLDDTQADLVETRRLGDLDLLKNLQAGGGLQGIRTSLFQLGLRGEIDRYFSYRLTNVREVSLPLVEAQNLFASQAFRDKCSGWRENIETQGWAAYQVLSFISGDLVFERRSDTGGGADVAVKLNEIEPKLKAELQSTFAAKVTGSGLVVSFNPLLKS